MNTLFGRKLQQTQGFLENGTRVPVTVIAASDNSVMGIKTLEKDTYMAVQLGFGKKKKPTKALLGSMKKANVTDAPQKLIEVRVDDTAQVQLGDMIKVEDVFTIGDIVDAIGTSKGKGFAGGVKRYGFAGGPKTHGQSDRHRAPGSIGSGTTPGRVYRGKRMAGNMGDERVTVKNLVVSGVDAVGKKLIIKGLVPGILGGIVAITKTGTVKEKKFVPLFQITDSTVDETVIEETVSPVEEVVASPKPQVEETTSEAAQAVPSEATTEEAPLAEEPQTAESTPEEVAEETK